MTQRNNLPADNMDNDPDSFVNFYKRSNAEKRSKLLGILSEQEKLNLYQFYFAEWDHEILRLQDQGNTGAPIARELYEEVAALQRGLYSGKRFNDFSEAHLFSVMHTSIDLLREVAADNTFGPNFQERLEAFNLTKENLYKQSKMSRTMGIMHALSAALTIACVIAVGVMSVFTYGLSLMLIPICLGLGVAGGLSAIGPSLGAHSFLTKAKREKNLADKMQTFPANARAAEAAAEHEAEAVPEKEQHVPLLAVH